MDLETQLPATERDARTALNNNFVKLQQEDEKDDAHINAVDAKHTELDQKYSKITNQIIARCDELQEGEEKLVSNVNDHERRLKKIEQLLFGNQSINATTISVDESDHQGYEIADIPPYDYAEQEIN